MSWTQCDKLEIDDFDKVTITLFKNNDGTALKMIVELFIGEPFEVCSRGEWISITVGRDKQRYFAYTVSRKKGIEPFKIYIASNTSQLIDD